MSSPIRFVLALHNHQPVGNFDNVCEQAYQDSYLPFLDVWDRHPSLPLALHTSGSLMEWLANHHPEYIDRLASLVEVGRLEIIGGAFYEPILSMLPVRDRVGQIQSYSQWLNDRLGANVRGMWIPERVWEAGLVSDLAQAGIEYTILDDFHFKHAGLDESQLHGYYLSEDQGQLIKVFPGSERLRYVIPFDDPQRTVDYLGEIASQHPGSVVVFGDDGEKFGSWPHTQKHVYEDGWLERFFTALEANSNWIKTTTLAEAVDNVPPVSKVYLPSASYREMTEWVLPSERLLEYDRLTRDLKHDERWPQMSKFIGGGFWRNFKVKYPETDEMYTRMLQTSKRLDELARNGTSSKLLSEARTELYRGQCNCSYWHGAFGGLYLPHLRNAVFEHLIRADNLLDCAAGRTGTWVESSVEDFNLDARPEVRIAGDKLLAMVAPAHGGILYELDVRSICQNLLATLARRPEAYHRKVLAGEQASADEVASIHDAIVFKQEGLDQKLIYDDYPRKSMVDHFYDNDVSQERVARGEAMERGDFAAGIYEARIRKSPERVQVILTRPGNAWGHPLAITKSLTLEAGSSTLKVEYELAGLPSEGTFHFAVEFNFSGLPAGAEDRYFHDRSGERHGHLGTWLDLDAVQSLGLTDEWLGIDVGLSIDRPSGIWAFPVETVNLSEGGFELVHQSVAVQPHWLVQGDADGKWKVNFELSFDTSLAESRRSPQETECVAR